MADRFPTADRVMGNKVRQDPEDEVQVRKQVCLIGDYSIHVLRSFIYDLPFLNRKFGLDLVRLASLGMDIMGNKVLKLPGSRL